MNTKWIEEKENLQRLLLEEKRSYEEVGRMYGCSGSNIKSVALRIGIELPPRRVINPKETFNKGVSKRQLKSCLNCGKLFQDKYGDRSKYCCCKCSSEHKHKLKYQDFLQHPEKYSKANYSPHCFKPEILEEQGGICAICGMKPEWNNKQLVFILDHIDGHASNNSRNNLRLICPNCDSQLDTYKSKNKCGERSYYRYHKDK